MKNQLLGIIKEMNCRFALKIEEAYTIPGRGTVLSGALLGHVRAGSSVGCLADARTLVVRSADMDVLVLQHFHNLPDVLEAWDEPIGCGILVQELPDPQSRVGMVFCGGYRVPQTDEMSDIADDLFEYRENCNGAAFALRIQEAFDLGGGEIGLMGYLQGAVIAGKSVACLYEGQGEYPLSEPVQVKSLIYRRIEEKVLVSDSGLLPCGIVIQGAFDPAALKGAMLIEWSKMM